MTGTLHALAEARPERSGDAGFRTARGKARLAPGMSAMSDHRDVPVSGFSIAVMPRGEVDGETGAP